MHDAVTTLFWHHLANEPTSIQHRLCENDIGPYLFFRRSKSAIQARLNELFPLVHVPQVLLHGSPHIDNYVKTAQGFGMVDFDRAYIGPYVWDIVCALLAIALRNPETHNSSIPTPIWQVFADSYLQHYQHPTLPYRAYAPLEFIKPKAWELDSRLYVCEQRKWAKKLDKNTLPCDDPLALALYKTYLSNLSTPHTLEHFKLKKIALATGSFGRQRFLYLLDNATQAPILIDIKQTRNYLDAAWPHNCWYSSPCSHQGERMIQAAQIYAPDCIQLESFATLNGVEYWGRQIPIMNRKPAKIFTEADQTAFAESAASQLGRGHRLALHKTTATALQQHFDSHFRKLVSITEQIQHELLVVWRKCIRNHK
jgi:uncharacterized protein (DUF2252 family)